MNNEYSIALRQICCTLFIELQFNHSLQNSRLTFSFQVGLLCPGGGPERLTLLRVVEEPGPVQLQHALLHLLLDRQQSAQFIYQEVTGSEKPVFLFLMILRENKEIACLQVYIHQFTFQAQATL